MDSESDPESKLRADLRALLQRAHDAGVDVEGAWECRNGEEYPDWDVLVSRVEKPDKSD